VDELVDPGQARPQEPCGRERGDEASTGDPESLRQDTSVQAHSTCRDEQVHRNRGEDDATGGQSRGEQRDPQEGHEAGQDEEVADAAPHAREDHAEQQEGHEGQRDQPRVRTEVAEVHGLEAGHLSQSVGHVAPHTHVEFLGDRVVLVGIGQPLGAHDHGVVGVSPEVRRGDQPDRDGQDQDAREHRGRTKPTADAQQVRHDRHEQHEAPDGIDRERAQAQQRTGRGPPQVASRIATGAQLPRAQQEDTGGDRQGHRHVAVGPRHLHEVRRRGQREREDQARVPVV